MSHHGSARRRVRIRLPLTALIVPAMILVCVIPLATTGGAWALTYLLPAAALAVVVTAGTTASESHLTARWWRGRSVMAWDDLDRLEFPGQRWAVAVAHSGRRMLLPGVRPKDLPSIVAAAGGRLLLRRPTAPHERHGETTGDDIPARG